MVYRDYTQPVIHDEKVQETGPTHFTGRVRKVIFSNPPFGILAVTVLTAAFDWDTEEITVKGDVGEINEGDEFEFEGQVVNNPRYGFEFDFTGFRHQLPHNQSELAAFLKKNKVEVSDQKQVAKCIYDALGEQAMSTLIGDADAVELVGGLAEDDMDKLRTFFKRLVKDDQSSKANRRLMQLGFSAWMIRRLQDHYQGRILKILDENIYQVVADYEQLGIGFRQIDEAARQYQGVAIDDPRRIDGALLFAAFSLVTENSGSFVSPDLLLNRAKSLLSQGAATVDQKMLTSRLGILLTQKKLYQEPETGIYPALFYHAENLIVSRLHQMMAMAPKQSDKQKRRIEKIVDRVAKEQNVDYDDQQRTAIQMALESPVVLLTGGPGTGKTTILNGIVRAYQLLLKKEGVKGHTWSDGEQVQLVAPTGRAAKQARQAITGEGVAASTIHHFLGIATDNAAAKLIEKPAPLENKGQMLVIDEMSMTSTLLMGGLMAVIPSNIHLVLVGDFDQLPSVGPGQVFRDLLESNCLPQVRLERIYRQDADSSLIPLAQRINKGDVDESFIAPSPATKYPKRIFVTTPAQNVPARVGQLVDAYLNGHDLDIQDIQILTPLRRHRDMLNSYLQEHLNPTSLNPATYRLRSRELRVGDKVMQTTNDPDAGVYNGDIGIIKQIGGTDKHVVNGDRLAKKGKEKIHLKVTVDFGGNLVKYDDPTALANLELAYAMTIHKAQGSQAPVIIVTLLSEFFPSNPQVGSIIQRNLLYTAVTRSSRALVMVGDAPAFVRCAKTPVIDRPTALREHLKQEWQREELTPLQKRDESTPVVHELSTTPETLTPSMVESQAIDPMIGMDGLSPADFA
jgi:exodeoxyribonuclease V alpha subunit